MRAAHKTVLNSAFWSGYIDCDGWRLPPGVNLPDVITVHGPFLMLWTGAPGDRRKVDGASPLR